MAYEIKELTGSLFLNEEKQGSQPDYTGNVKINGKTWRLAAWETTSQGGREYLSIKITDPEEFKRQQEQRNSGGQRSGGYGNTSQSDFEKRRAEMRQRGEQARQQRDFGDDLADDDIPF